jgi:hypothetical protein
LKFKTEILNSFNRKPLQLYENKFFININKKLSNFCLEETKKEYLKACSEMSSVCTGYYSKSMGIPCKHILVKLLIEHKQLDIIYFNNFWNLERIIEPISTYNYPGLGNNFFLKSVEKNSIEKFSFKFKIKEKRKRGHNKSTKRNKSYYEKRKDNKVKFIPEDLLKNVYLLDIFINIFYIR